jgi:geranylgeranyl pyrophosphate synthase
LKTALRLISLLEPIRPEMERVEHLLHETLADADEPVNSMLLRLLDGGKRLRPALVILIGRMFGCSTAPFHSLAAAVEMLHTATLIHDDVVDEAPLRRGRKTLHTIWPAAATVLAGDYLLAQAVSLTAQLNHPRIVKVLAETLCTMSTGEIRQMFVTKGKHSTRENYYQSIEAKAASLFAGATEMAGILAEAKEPQIAALRRFGQELGMAFQMVDDVLDLVGDQAHLGKPAGSDFRQGLITLPTLYYLETANDDTAVNAVLSDQRDEEQVRAAIEAVISSGAVEASLAEARAHARHSQEALAALPDNASRQMLSSLAGYVVERRC